MFDVNLVKLKNLLTLVFVLNGRHTETNHKPADPDGLWDFITQGLNINTNSKQLHARNMFALGNTQLTAPCNNLRGEMESAYDGYLESIDDLSTAEIRRIDEVATEAIVATIRGVTIDQDMLFAAGNGLAPQAHRALSYKVRELRAGRQLAVLIPHDYHRDYTDLRRRLRTRPPIHEVEQDLPSFWQRLRADLV